jgi:hypothetical protein
MDARSGRGVAHFSWNRSLSVIQGWPSLWCFMSYSSIILFTLVMTDDTPVAIAFQAAVPNGHRRMKW